MKKEHQIIHIPTNEPDYWWKNLYILSDEEIKEGDWFIVDGKVYSWKKGFMVDSPPEDARKIIATTDPNLLTRKEYEGLDESAQNQYRIIKGLPQIPQSFIEEYCKAGGIDKVLVEYEMETQLVNGYENQPKDVVGFVAEYEPTGSYKPKTDSNNCIIIHPVEEKMYSRKEVEVLCRNAHLLGMKETLPGYPKTRNN